MTNILIRRTVVFCALFIFGSVVCETAVAQIQTTFTVNTTSDTVVANACSTAGPGCSLRGAMQVANVGDVRIAFNIPPTDSNCVAGVCTITLGSSPLPTLLGSNITIDGPGPDRLIITRPGIQLPPVFRVNNVSGTRIIIAGLTINNVATGISLGPITKEGGGAVDVINMVLSNNRASSGGAGILVVSGTVNVIRSMFDTNTVDNGNGGAIKILASGVCVVSNSSIRRNNTAGDGGGIHVEGSASVTNSTITDNTAFNGGGIRSVSGVINVKSTIVARNSVAGTGPDLLGNFGSSGFNLIGKTDGSTGFTSATDQTGTVASPLDPRFHPYNYRLNGGTTRTLGLRPDSPAIDKGSSSSLGTGVLTTDQRSTGFKRTRDNPLVPNAAGGDGTDIGAYERHTYSAFDFDGDGRTDVGIFRPSGGQWWIDPSLVEFGTTAVQFGTSADRMGPGDFTGDGLMDIAFWRPSDGVWYVLRTENFSFFSFPFGTNGDTPTTGDFDGDFKADAAVFRPSTGTWFILRSTGGVTVEQFGINGDVPVASDYDGDGRTDIAIYRPSNGQWWLKRSTAGVVAFTFGSSTDKVAPGDFTGDNKADVAFWRPSTGQWFVLRSEDQSFFSFAFGLNADIPAPGDYDGDGKFDATVFRPSSATWFSLGSLGGTLIQQFGANGDRPLASAYIP